MEQWANVAARCLYVISLRCSSCPHSRPRVAPDPSRRRPPSCLSRRRLRRRFPGLEFRFDGNSDVIDLEASEFDCAIRMGRGPWPGLVTHRIGKLTAAMVCSPELADRLRQKSDLFQFPLIELRGHEHEGWHAYLKAKGKATESASILMLRTYLEILLAVEQGLGVAFATFPLTTKWVELGRIAVPFAARVPLPAELCLVHHPAHRERELFQELAIWLSEEYARLPPLARWTHRTAGVERQALEVRRSDRGSTRGRATTCG